jgi:hypothetical protein
MILRLGIFATLLLRGGAAGLVPELSNTCAAGQDEVCLLQQRLFLARLGNATENDDVLKRSISHVQRGNQIAKVTAEASGMKPADIKEVVKGCCAGEEKLVFDLSKEESPTPQLCGEQILGQDMAMQYGAFDFDSKTSMCYGKPVVSCIKGEVQGEHCNSRTGYNSGKKDIQWLMG